MKLTFGFTLVELVIGLVVLSIALMIMTGALFPQAQRSVNPWFQVRSAELAQSVMNEIIARKYDHQSATIANLRCNESGASPCTTIGQCDDVTYPWIEEGGKSASKDVFNDVDDFHCYRATGAQIRNIENETLNNTYAEFTVSVRVEYETATIGDAKLITVTVTPPVGNNVVYASYKANY